MRDGEIVLTLASWAVKQDGDKFYVAKSWTGKHDWSKPYKSLTQACNAIARHLEREWTKRRTRQEQFSQRFPKKKAA